MMSKSKPPPAEVYAPNPPDYHQHAYPHHGYPQHGYQPGPYHQPPAPQPSHGPVINQPVSQSTNVVLNVGGGVGKGQRRRPWTTSLCGCCGDIAGCMCAWCCTPCFLAQLTMQLNECFCTPFCVPEALMAMRVKIREANGIQGSICEDCVCTTCCPMLSMCQMKREMDNIALRRPGTEL